MLNPKIKSYLVAKYPEELVDSLLYAYNEILINYRIEKWKPSELDAGHFVEATRRIIESELTGSYTPLSTSLSRFNQGVLNSLESSSGDEVFRILIPRVLYSMYCIRNKRGVGHISSISPNKLDASYILNSAKWVLAELVRITASSSPDDAYELTSTILEREIDLIWDDGESFVIMDRKLNAQQKVLICLYKNDRKKIEELRDLIEYTNKSTFKKIILKLKSLRLIDIIGEDVCKLSPLGLREAEKIIQKS